MPIAPGTYWDLLDRTTPPIKRRATHAKARTGCLTCKRRKVKCDEAKPACARCLRSGHRCAGYEEAGVRLTSASARRRDAEAADGNGSNGGGGGNRSTALLRPKPMTNLVRASLTPAYLEDVGDALYFERFKCQVIADVGTWCGADYWRCKILREVLTDKTVQHAALGAAAMLMDIEQQQQYAYARASRKTNPRSTRGVPNRDPTTKGAAGETARTRSQGRAGAGGKEARGEGEEDECGDLAPALPVVPLSNRSAHGKAALRHYTASIGLSRRTLATEGMTKSTARPSLTATFFYAIFELVQGNVGEADRLLSNGVSLLDDALSQHSADGSPALVADDELHEVQLAFDRMRVTWGLCPYFGSSARDGSGGRSIKRKSGTVLRFELPAPDASVRTKQVFWNGFSSEFGQFMVDVQEMFSRTATAADEKHAALPAILAQRTDYLVQLRYWLPILEDLCAQDPGSVILCTTKAYAQTAIIFLNCFLDPSEVAYDAYEPVFTAIVTAYEHLLPRRHEKQTQQQCQHERQGCLRFTLDVDLFHIITFTVSKCRHRATRLRALRVFGEMTRRQALWTNSGMLAALWALADLENRGRRDGPESFVPPEARYRYVESEWDFQNRRMLAVFVPLIPVSAQPSDVSSAVRIAIHF
ncbi:hypothetical protein F5Y03DRAFT_204829 [Xylaria venustula]|nr:hypothetical protein F5Y03DRAFT_204829 [Xylaria venustula]